MLLQYSFKIEKRDLWTYTETEDFIKILKENQILKLMDSKRFRVVEIFKFLKNEMKNIGYSRNATQIQIKFKALKRKYKYTLHEINLYTYIFLIFFYYREL